MATLNTWLRSFGIDLKRTISTATNLPRFLAERHQFRSQLPNDFAWGTDLPILDERGASSGTLGAYFHQDGLVAKWIFENAPKRHVDIGSRIDGFIGHLAVFREVEVLDIRPQPHIAHNIIFRQLDLMEKLPEHWIECTDSLSCLHTIEHFGLGRYGDSIDPNGYQKGLEQLKRMVKPGGMLYLSTPIGPQRVEFNAHRIFAAETLRSWFKDTWEIEKFAIINDAEELEEAVNWRSKEIEEHFGCQLGVGIVAARKVE
jgi:SAM-dependent methyltransferase